MDMSWFLSTPLLPDTLPRMEQVWGVQINQFQLSWLIRLLEFSKCSPSKFTERKRDSPSHPGRKSQKQRAREDPWDHPGPRSCHFSASIQLHTQHITCG